MAEQVESPTVEEPKVAAPPAKPAANVDELLTELERAGVTNAVELQNKFKASSEVGRMAQLLGDERKRSRELEDEITKLANRPAARAPEDPFAASESRPIDIESVLERTVDKVLTARETKQRKMQEVNIAAWNQIQQDEDYPLVRPVWEEKLKDPNFVFKIQSGMIDPINAYTETVRVYYKTMMKRSVDTIKQLRGDKPVVNPLHVETGERTSANLVSTGPADDKKKKIEQYHDRIKKKGPLSTDEQIDFLDVILGGGTQKK